MASKLDKGLLHELWHRVFNTEDAAQLLLRTAREAIEGNATRRTEARTFASCFEGLELTSFGGDGYQYDNTEVFPNIDQPMIKNTIRSIGMTAVAKMTANDTPLSQFMTNGGGWAEQVKSVRMGRLVDAEVEQPQGLFATLHEMHRHGATLAINATGSYLIFFFKGDNGVRCELDDTMSVGIETSGRFGRITSLVRTVWYDADELATDFPDYADDIYDNEQINPDGVNSVRVGDDDTELRPRRGVKVVQGWSCSYKNKVGRQMWVLEDGTPLFDEDYDRKYPPMVKWDYERQLYGVWGVPLTRSIYEMAVRENRMLCDMDNAERNSPQCCMILPENAEKEGDLDEARGWAIIRAAVPDQIHFATPPKYNQMSADFVDRLQVGMQDVSGISNQHSAAQKAQGTTSGKHEHLVAGLFTERFADQERRLIQCRAVDTARQIVYALKDLLEDEPEFSRVWSRGDKSEEIKVADLDLDVSKYTITIAAVSEDKDTPKARMDKAYDWLQMGLITGTEFASIQQTYATQEKGALVIAQEQWLEKQIDKWLHSEEDDRMDEGFYQGPTEWIDLPAALRQVSMAQLQARSRNAPSDVLEWFDKFLAEASDYIDQDQAQAQTSISTDAAGASTIFPGISDQQAPAAAPMPGATIQ
jgi:hypothetical protein